MLSQFTGITHLADDRAFLPPLQNSRLFYEVKLAAAGIRVIMKESASASEGEECSAVI